MASVSSISYCNSSAANIDDTLALFWLDGVDMDGKYPYPHPLYPPSFESIKGNPQPTPHEC